MNQSLRSVLFMFLITLCFTSLVSGVKYFNQERIERNQTLKLQKIILRVLNFTLPGTATDQQVIDLFQQRVKPFKVGKQTVYVGYDQDGRTVKGFALPVGGPGFWGPIHGMVGIGPQARKLLGLAFYKHMETPGLGGRISEEWFQKQFQGLPLHPIEGDRMIFYLKPPGKAKGPDQLDAITGATNTSSAVQNFLNRDLNEFLTRIFRPLEDEIGKNV